MFSSGITVQLLLETGVKGVCLDINPSGVAVT